MKLLENIWMSLSEHEKSGFERFISHRHSKQNRADLDYLNSRLNAPGKIPNKDAAIRKRLNQELIKYVNLLMADGLNLAAKAQQKLNVASYLLEHKRTKEGWRVLRSVENWAQEHLDYHLLNDTYLVMIRYASSAHSEPLNELISKKKRAEHQRNEEEELALNLAQIKDILTRQIETGVDQFDSISEIMTKSIESNHIYDHPKQTLDLIEMVRSYRLARRNLSDLPQFIDPIYEQVFKSDLPDLFLPEKCRCLYILAHAHYRNHNYETADGLLKELTISSNQLSKQFTQRYQAKIIALRTAMLFLSGDLESASSKLEAFLTGKNAQADVKDGLNLHLTLVTLLSCQKRHQEAYRYFSYFKHSDGWYAKKMGRDWVMRKNVIKAMIEFDLGRDDLALLGIKSVQRNFEDMFALRYYELVGPFLEVLVSFIDRPDTVNPELILSLENQMEWTQGDADVKKLAYFSWLKARVKGTEFYQEMLDLIDVSFSGKAI